MDATVKRAIFRLHMGRTTSVSNRRYWHGPTDVTYSTTIVHFRFGNVLVAIGDDGSKHAEVLELTGKQIENIATLIVNRGKSATALHLLDLELFVDARLLNDIAACVSSTYIDSGRLAKVIGTNRTDR